MFIIVLLVEMVKDIKLQIASDQDQQFKNYAINQSNGAFLPGHLASDFIQNKIEVGGYQLFDEEESDPKSFQSKIALKAFNLQKSVARLV